MTAPKQRTLSKDVTLDGVGVHTGDRATITIKPADEGRGIRFVRTDLEGNPEIPADLDQVIDTRLGTSLKAGDARVHTVEHLMAALYAARIDNALVEVDGPEIPIRDGSFQDFVEALAGAGVAEQDAPARVVSLPSAVSSNGKKGESYIAAPARGLALTVSINFEHPSIGHQIGSWDVAEGGFAAHIAPARTFGFAADAEALQADGRALGASLENSIVLDDGGVMNDGLRFPDEFVRHKAGDLVGDLALLGARLDARIVADRPSHTGNVAFAKALREHARRAGRMPVTSIDRIMEFLPHRYPILLVDRIIDYEPGKRIVGIKNVTINEPFFQGHYPGHPVMPGVLIVESMAQVGGLMLMEAVENPEDKVVYFMSLDGVKWRRPVTPGDTLVFELEMVQFRRGICRMRGEAFVEGVLVAEGDLMARIMDK